MSLKLLCNHSLGEDKDMFHSDINEYPDTCYQDVCELLNKRKDEHFGPNLGNIHFQNTESQNRFRWPPVTHSGRGPNFYQHLETIGGSLYPSFDIGKSPTISVNNKEMTSLIKPRCSLESDCCHRRESVGSNQIWGRTWGQFAHLHKSAATEGQLNLPNLFVTRKPLH